jgi:zinc and cadmium transporter
VLVAGLLSFTVLTAWVPRMVSFAVGTMLAVAFLELLPEAFTQADSVEGLFAVTLAGVLAFFLLEKAALWRHRHEHSSDHGAGTGAHAHGPHRVGLLIIVGDGIHNLVDGVLIAAAFLTDIRLGVTTAVAIVAHELPQEIGDFMVLLHSGYERRRALMLNLASSLAAVIGGVVGYFALEDARQATPYVLVLAAASFIYIAVADLIPDLHRSSDGRSTAWQVALIAAGVATIAAAHWLLHQH